MKNECWLALRSVLAMLDGKVEPLRWRGGPELARSCPFYGKQITTLPLKSLNALTVLKLFPSSLGGG